MARSYTLSLSFLLSSFSAPFMIMLLMLTTVTTKIPLHIHWI